MSVIPLEAASPGDIVFFDSSGDVAWAIRLAQRIRWRGDKNHVAWLDHRDAHGNWYIGQAEGCGVTTDKPLVFGPKDVVMAPPTAIDRARFIAFGRNQVGRRYGFLTIASIFATLLTPKFFDIMLPSTWICSALVAEALRFGGWYHPWPDIYQVAPDQLFGALTA
jgi:hypothetical protein